MKDLYPKYEIIILGFFIPDMSKLKIPEASVIVPLFDPVTITEAPSSG